MRVVFFASFVSIYWKVYCRIVDVNPICTLSSWMRV